MEVVKRILRAGARRVSDVSGSALKALSNTGPEDRQDRNGRQQRAERPASGGSRRRIASGAGGSLAAIFAATLALTGGAGEQDARTSFVLEPQIRYVAEFTGASVATQARPPGAPIPVSAYVAPPFIWPAEGPITSYLSGDHPLGIDIGLSAERSREIKAAAAGTVTFSGGSDDESYGFYIVIAHGNGVETLYGHLSQRIVQAGAIVQQGQLIGIGGSSGKSDGMHLHFEVTKDGQVFDPLKLLPYKPSGSEPLDLACQAEVLTIDAGSRVTLDLAAAVEPGESITGISIADTSGSPVDGSVLDAVARGATTLDVWSAFSFAGPASEDAYILTITTALAGRPVQTIGCELHVHTPRILPSYYMPRTATQSQATASATPKIVSQMAPAVTQAPDQATEEATEEVLEPVIPPDFPTGLATFTPVPLTPVATSTPTSVPATSTPTKVPATSTAAPSPTATRTPAP